MPAHVVVLYNPPKDPAAFERYYAVAHLPLLYASAAEIGYTSATFVKFTSGLDGSAPSLYRKAELTFPSMDALKKGTATNGFKQVAGDLAHFATGGVTAFVGDETNQR